MIYCHIKFSGLNLNEEDTKLFSNKVESYVSVVSRLFRRSSLILYYHIMRLENEGILIPDLYTIPSGDTYWKRWLQIGLSDKIPFPDIESETSYNLMIEKFKDNQLADDMQKLKYFDQILGYAGHTFWTSIENNTWYPLFDKLTRLCKAKLDEWKITTISKSDLMHQIRSPIEEMSLDLDNRVEDFIIKVKALLNASNNPKYITDTHAQAKSKNMTFTQAFKFNMWMQNQFQLLEKRLNIMIPIFKVKRTHIRLDLKTLTFLLQEIFPNHESIIKYNAQYMKYEEKLKHYDTILNPPRKQLLPLKIETKKRKECSKEDWKNYKKSLEEYKIKCIEIKNTDSYKKQVKNTISKAPHKKMLPPKIEPKKKKNCNDDEWKEYKRLLEEYKIKTKEVTSDDLFKQIEKDHKEHFDNQLKMIQSFFKKIRKGNKWTFDGTIQTDGIALSRQFSYIVKIENKPTEPKEKILIVEDYNKNLSCFIKELNTLVIGLDPGRTNLASISYYWVKDNGETEKKFWSLTRRQYYQESGINKRNKEKTYRFKPIADQWSVLGTLRTTTFIDIIDYIDKYNLIKDTWWSLALDKQNSIDALRSYSGKQRVQDKFFVKIKKELKKSYPGVNIMMAYGSAYRAMKPNGLGEVSAPISATYKSCKRIFNTVVENEDYTTKIDWEYGTESKKVYKKFREENGKVFETFGNCDAKKRSPIVRGEENIAMVKSYNERVRKRKKSIYIETKEVNTIHYPEIRGLRFCQESRNYVDRDRKSSLAIARLAVMRMTLKSRPKVFSKTKV